MIVDVEQILVKFLAEHPAVIDLAGEQAVSTELPPNATLPRLRVTLTGGAPRARNWLMDYSIVLEAWGTTKADSLELLAVAAHALETELDGAQVEQGTVTGCTQDSGVSWSPDPESDQPRYLTTFTITAHPNP